MPVPVGTFAVVRLSTILWPYYISSHHDCQKLSCSSALSTGPGVFKSFSSVIPQTQLGTASVGQRWPLLSPLQVPTHTRSGGEQRLLGQEWGPVRYKPQAMTTMRVWSSNSQPLLQHFIRIHLQNINSMITLLRALRLKLQGIKHQAWTSFIAQW